MSTARISSVAPKLRHWVNPRTSFAGSVGPATNHFRQLSRAGPARCGRWPRELARVVLADGLLQPHRYEPGTAGLRICCREAAGSEEDPGRVAGKRGDHRGSPMEGYVRSLHLHPDDIRGHAVAHQE